jgi:hypothetical protein
LSHAKSDGATHTRVTPIKMMWLILGTERCDGTSRIDVAADVHVEVSRTKGVDTTVENHVKCTSTTKKGQIWK